ncbi:MAG: preprotein translocase subunit YajC [Pseudomonadales bacterium]|jgi:preprotein translocase subunit YajC|nr:preprotein translocase subunit YajC [Pseudomonadales bacterium]
MSFFINSAYAQAADGAAQPTTQWGVMGFYAILLVVFYFFLIRPQSRRAKEHRALLAALKVGDEVMSSGGLLGRITRIDDFYIALQVAENVELKLQRSAISAVLPKGTLKSI